MKINLQNQENIRALQEEIFPYFMSNWPFLRMIESLLLTSKHHRKEVDISCRQLVKDYTGYEDKENNVTRKGWNTLFQQKLRNIGINTRESLLLHRYWEYDDQMAFNIIFLISSGRYHLATREMRFVLESFVHAFCVDKTYESYSLENKIEILENKGKRFWNKKDLFTKTFQNYINIENLGIEMYEFYKELSGKVHASYEELSDLRRTIKKYGKGSNISAIKYFYNEEKLVESLNIFSRLHNYLIKILDCF